MDIEHFREILFWPFYIKNNCEQTFAHILEGGGWQRVGYRGQALFYNIHSPAILTLMPRPTRIQYENAFYHVMNRVRGRQAIFRGDTHYQAFLQTLEKVRTYLNIIK